MKTGTYVLGAASALLISTSAIAAGDAAAGLQAMRELNVIVFTDMAGNQDIQGKTFVGGTISGTRNYGVGNPTQGAASSSRPTLTVGGGLTGGATVHNGPNGASGPIAAVPSVVIGGDAHNLHVNNDVGNIQVGGSIVGPFSNKDQPGFTIRAGGSIFPGPANPGAVDVVDNLGASFADPLRAGINAETATLQANLTALSAAMGGFETTLGSGIDYSNPDNVKLTAVAGSDGFAVVNTDAFTFFSQTRALTYDFAPGLTTIVNISGAAAIWNFETLSGSAYNSSVIFNFVDGLAVTINQGVHGSILAPYAALIGPAGPIEGTLVAFDYKQNGPSYPGPPVDPPVIPEPSTWAMMIAGFGLLGATMRRRRTPLSA